MGWRLEREACGQQVGQRASPAAQRAEAVGVGIQNSHGGGIRGELQESLAAGAAGSGGSVVEIGHCNGVQADVWAEFCHGAGDGCLLRAGGEAKAGVLHVAGGDDGAGVGVGEEKGGADAKAGVRRVAVCSGGAGTGVQIRGDSGRE